MENVARVGIDLGKQVFHLTAVDAGGEVVERRRLRRTGLRSYLSELPRGAAWWRWRVAAGRTTGRGLRSGRGIGRCC